MARRLINFDISVSISQTVLNTAQWFGLLPNTVTITGLRMSYSIGRDLKKHPNACELSIYNLAEHTRHELQASGLMIDVLAGYDGDLRRIFQGDVLYVISQRDGADWVTKIQMHDGLRAYNYARITRTYPANTPYKVIVTDIASAMDLDMPLFTPSAEALLQKQTPGSVSLSGPAANELTRFLAPHGMEWSIQEGELVILRDKDVRSGDAIVITEDDGMIGSPSYGNPDKKGRSPMLTVKCLPYPEIAPGKLISVESRDIRGVFRVEKVVHKGDSWGDGRETTTEARQVKDYQVKPA